MRLLAYIVVIGLIALPAWADWNPGDSYKMHFPQLPDPTGWDVYATDSIVLADDWQCTETGPVTDIHFWGSWQLGQVGVIQKFHLSIHADTARNPEGGVPFSHPGTTLWEQDFYPNQWTERLYGTGEQGWFNPNTGESNRPDHQEFFQYNFRNITAPYVQSLGTIYWLDVSATIADPDNTHWGWKTADTSLYPPPNQGRRYRDDAVWNDIGSDWNALTDPEIEGESLDLAFVITPEPSTLAMLVGVSVLGIGTWLRRRKN
jgi:hypothetical protein